MITYWSQVKKPCRETMILCRAQEKILHMNEIIPHKSQAKRPRREVMIYRTNQTKRPDAVLPHNAQEKISCMEAMISRMAQAKIHCRT